MRAFQDARHLPADGICGPMTWAALVEASYRLGDRLLYRAHPMLRGDDVAELQRRLGRLGFDAGRVDGIFGPETETALVEFQRNVGETADGIFGPDSRSALERVAGRATAEEPLGVIAGVREREQLRTPRTMDGCTVVVAAGEGLTPFALTVGRALRAAGAGLLVVSDPDRSDQARRANTVGAAVVVALEPAPSGCEVAYYATSGFESSGGRRLAELLAPGLATSLGLSVSPAVRGMPLPILRETRMPAAVCRMGPPEAVAAAAGPLADAIADAVRRWVQAPVEP